MKGFGGMIPNAEAGEMTVTYTVDEPREYSVSVWHTGMMMAGSL